MRPAPRAAALVVSMVASVGLVAPVPSQAAKPPKPPKPSVTRLTPASGSVGGGVTVKLKGKHLTGAKKVLFGSTKGTQLKVKSAKKLTVVAPAHAAGVVDVVVVTKGGKSKKVAADHFTYQAAAVAPTVSAIAPTSGPTTGGTVVTVTGTGFSNVTEVAFGGVAGTAVIVASPSQLTVTSPAHAVCPVDVQVTTGAGASAVSAADRFSYVELAAATPGAGQTAPLPCNAVRTTASTVADVACPAAGSCQAVGYYGTTQGRHALLETLSGGTWSPTDLPLPTGVSTTSANAELTDITCPTTTFCAAVGEYDDTAAHHLPLLETWNGTAWTATGLALPAPAGASAVTFMNAVDCSSAGSCVAVGRYSESSASHPLIATLAAGVWSFRTVPLPAGATAALLDDVACSGGQCAAVGTVTPSGGSARPLIETGSGASWTHTEPALPGDTAAPPLGYLFDVSCASAQVCVAVGSYVASTGHTQALITSLSGATWSSATVAPPAGAAADPQANLFSVSCPSVVYCAAGGTYLTGPAFDSSHAMIVTISSGTPSAHDVSLPGGAHPTAPQATLNHIVCPTFGSCAGAGYYHHADGQYVGLLARVSGSVQPGVQVASPAGATSLALNGLANDTATTAVAVGGYSGTSGSHGVLVTGVPVGPPPAT